MLYSITRPVKYINTSRYVDATLSLEEYSGVSPPAAGSASFGPGPGFAQANPGLSRLARHPPSALRVVKSIYLILWHCFKNSTWRIWKTGWKSIHV